MVRLPVAASLLALLFVATPPASGLQDPQAKAPPNDMNAPLPVRVNQAIDSGVRWLSDKDGKAKTNIFAPGNWSPEITSDTLYDPNAKGDPFVHPTGCTSLALYTLLKCGVPKDDPVIVKGFQWLRTGRGGITKGKLFQGDYRVPNGTYELAMLILALEARANPHKREAERERELKFKLKKGEKLNTGVKLDAEDQTWMRELVAALVKRLNVGAGWRYGQWTGAGFHNGVRGNSDMSASQLAMLALMAAERCGFQQPETLYANVLNWTLGLQEKEGPPIDRWDPVLAREAAKAKEAGDTISAVAPVKDKARGWGYLSTSGAVQVDENVATGSMTACGLGNIIICTGVLESRESKLYTPEMEARAEKAWWDGVAWLDNNWTVDRNINHGSYHYYYLYCLERACDMKRVNLLAGHPWYNEGALVLVDEQLNGDDGSWIKNDTHRPSNILNTCFALLFLNRSTPAITGD
jgi:hypothetical protein